MSTDVNMEYQEVKFGDICREVKLTTKDPIADGYDKYIGLEHLDSGSLKIKRWGLIAEDNPTFTRVFKKGHILIGKRRPYLKKAAIAEFDGICSGDIIVVDKKDNVVDNIIILLIIHNDRFWEHAVQTSSGSLSPRTKFSLLSDFIVSLKSIDAQKSILDLYESYEKIDKAHDDLIASIYNLKNNIVHKCLIGDYEKFSCEEFSISNKKLKDLISINYGKSPLGIKKDNGEYPILGSSGVVGYSDEYLVDSDELILLGRKGTIDKPIYFKGACWPIDTTFYCLSKKSEILNLKWLFFVLEGVDLRSLNEGSGVPSLSRTTLEKIDISVPDKFVQDVIVNLLEKIEAVETMSLNKIINVLNILKNI
ncbi:restriction endonuclease subunit S [Acinetobacter sp. BWR-L5]|uniref:restriction endonuclease subunit S n=1 Tax=Acinetobacter sp. BWR-L5 TaxID=2815725 RepID=UPI0031FEAE6A